MAFPTTGVLDDFDRANEGPPPSSNWTSAIEGSGGGHSVLSNQMKANSTPSSNWWNAAQFGPDCEVHLEIVTFSNGSYVWIRIQSPGSAAVDGYLVFIATTTITTYRCDNGGFTQLGASDSVTYSNGDSVGLEAIGTDISVYRKTGGSWGAAVQSRSDATYSTGFIGVRSPSISSIWDNFGGGTVVGVEPPAPTLRLTRSNLVLA